MFSISIDLTDFYIAASLILTVAVAVLAVRHVRGLFSDSSSSGSA